MFDMAEDLLNLPVEVSTTLTEHDPDFWETEYIVRHRFFTSNQGLGACLYRGFTGEKISESLSTEAIFSFMITAGKRNLYPSVQLYVKSTQGRWPQEEHCFTYQGPSLEGLVLTTYSEDLVFGPTFLLSWRKTYLAQSRDGKTALFQGLQRAGLDIANTIVKSAEIQYGVNPLQRGKAFIRDVDRANFTFTPF